MRGFVIHLDGIRKQVTMKDIVVHPRISERHPDISETDVKDAWESCILARPRLDRSPNEYIAIGADSKGRLIEMIACMISDGTWIIYHAFTPPTKKALYELGLVRRP
jgi:hypothetical protein